VVDVDHHLERINCTVQKLPGARECQRWLCGIDAKVSVEVSPKAAEGSDRLQAKRTMVVAHCRGVEVNNATHHVGKTGHAIANLIRWRRSYRICSSLSDPYLLPRSFRAIDNGTFPFCDRSCLSIFHYAAFGKYNKYIREPSDDDATRFQYALWIHREFEEWYLDNAERE